MYSAYQFGKRPGEAAGAETRAIVAANGEPITVVSAPAEPLRSPPEEPGGLVAPDQARAAYESLGPRPIEPASARVTEFQSAEETERPAGPMAARAVESADSIALRARNTEIHSIGLAAVPPRADMTRPGETFALNAPERDLAAPGLAAALSSSSGGAGAPAASASGPLGPRASQAAAAGGATPPSGLGPVASTALGAPVGAAPGAAPRGPTVQAAQAQTQPQAGIPNAGAPFAAPGGVAPIGPSVATPAGVLASAAEAAPTAEGAALAEAPQASPPPRPRPTPAASSSVVSQVRAVAGIDVSAAPAAQAQPVAPTGFAPQSQVQAQPRVFAPGQATMTLGQDFAATAAGVDPRAAAAQAEAQRLALIEAQRAQAEAIRLAQTPAQPPAQPQYAAAQPQYLQPQPQFQPQPAAAARGAQIQLGALPSPDQVQQRWASLQRSNPDLLGSLRLDIQPVTTGAGQQLFRLRAGPLADQNSARNLCAALQARGVDCYAPPS